MQLEITTERLRAELTFIKSIIEKRGKDGKTSLPQLQNVLFVTSSKPAAAGVLRLVGTDLDHTLQCDVEAKIVEPGSLCVRAKTLFDIATNLPADKVVVIRSLENNWADVRCEASHYKVAGLHAGQFPEVAKLNDGAARTTMSAERLRTFITRTIFAVSLEESRYQLAGAQLSINRHRDRVVTTDGHRLAKIEGNGMNRESLASEVNALVPRKAMNELLKLTQNVKGDVEFGADDNHLFFKVGGRQLISRQLTGQFPNWEMIIPPNFERTAAVVVGPLKDALKRVALMTDDRRRDANFHFAAGELTLHAQTAEDGEAHETVPIENFAGDELDIKLNVEYVGDVLNALSANDVVEFQINDANTQVGIRPLGETGVSYTTITMPLRP